MLQSFPYFIHALLAESDGHNHRRPNNHQYFYPRSPCGERRPYPGALTATTKFLSTLSLRRATETDGILSTGAPDFYPRSPCGERPVPPVLEALSKDISIHALLAESDLKSGPCHGRLHISIHALLAESDPVTVDSFVSIVISIHALLAESDLLVTRWQTCVSGFLSTLSLRRATLF